jgi:tyrosine decarboxylase
MKKEFNPINFEAYFLGPKAENSDFYSKLLQEAFQKHCDWRRAFGHLDPKPFISENDRQREDFKEAQDRIKVTLERLQELLKTSQPFFSPRYIGHMNWEIMAAPLIASFSAALYNPNNVARAGSTGTSDLELQVGDDFVKLFGFQPGKAWGHICTGGTIANMEALWMARNMKIVPLALNKLLKHFKVSSFIFKLRSSAFDLLKLNSFELLSAFNPEDIIDLKDNVLEFLKSNKHFPQQNDPNYIDNLLESFSIQATGLLRNSTNDNNDQDENIDIGVVFLPSSKHYSLKKTMDLLGLGTNNICYVPVNRHFRMDINELEKEIKKIAGKRPVLAVVGVLGSTEESAVDQIDQIVDLRTRLNKQNIGFHIHVDAAYGGYIRTLFLDEEGSFMNKSRLDEYLKTLGIIGDKPERTSASWPTPEIFNAYEALGETDTITVDPHKLGYVLYPAGGIAMKDKRMRESIQVFAPYVFPKPKPGEPDLLIGAYILEGSKPGASAAAVWTAHRIMPLNISGYGKLIGETIDGAQALYYGLANAEPCKLSEKTTIEFIPLLKPDLNIVNYFSISPGIQTLN